jgi:hypothetical protein
MHAPPLLLGNPPRGRACPKQHPRGGLEPRAWH